MSTGAERRPTAVRLLRDAVDRAKRVGNVAFPPTFVRRPDDDETEDPTPMSRLIRGGQGGEVRLKLYLCITMMATSKPYDIRRPFTPQTWARLLGLPEETGPRRINSNLRWLDEHGYISLQPRAAAPPAITLLSATGDGSPFTRPSDTGRYIGIPIELWTQGWLIDLSPIALTLLFALKELQGGNDRPQYVNRRRRDAYRLSADTWTRATKELVGHGLLTVGRTPQGNDFDFLRLRNTYWINEDRLTTPPTPRIAAPRGIETPSRMSGDNEAAPDVLREIRPRLR